MEEFDDPKKLKYIEEVQQNGHNNSAFEHDDKNDTLQNEKVTKDKGNTAVVGYFELFCFADKWDILLMVLGLVCAMASGTGLPIMIIVFGEMTDAFVKSGIAVNVSQFNTTSATSTDCSQVGDIDIEAEMTRYSYYYIGIGAAVFVLSVGQIWTFLLSATRQSHRIRQKFFKAVLHQEMSWFDANQIGTLNNRLTEDINTIHEGLGDKICIFVQFLATFVAGIIIGFVKGWKLTLVILSVSPLLGISAMVWTKLLTSYTIKELAAYAKAGAVAEEILTAIRTVVAFNGQEKALSRYNSNLVDAKKVGIRKSITTNTSMGLTQFFIFGAYALAFWYGTKLTIDEKENYSIGTVLIVFFSVLIGTFSLGQAAPNVESISNARGAAYEVYKIINQYRPIDSSSEDGHKPDRLIGQIEFKNIHFTYPSRPESQILKGLNLKVEAGKTIALVGASGCGKSTTIQLLQRFYDPQVGEVTVDGHDIRTLNVKWLRENIGVVSQEPILFGTTIKENICYGRESVTDEEIIQATKEANAYDFISKLPDTFDTMVGERGAQLSGGQKQRIAIARALVRNPKILLLDEATSALDTQSESVVQSALDKARAGRTTIVIAHRLSTIRTADVIAGFHNGVVVEQGSHEDLMNKQGVYYSLVMLQNHGRKAEEVDEEESEEDTDGQEFEYDDEDDNNYNLQEVTSPDSPGKEIVRRESLRRSSKRKSRTSSKRKSKSKPSNGKPKQVEEDLPNVSLGKILALNSPELPYIVFGIIAAAISGGIYPTFAVIFGKVIGAFSEQDLNKKSQQTILLSLMFLALGVISLIVHIVMGFTFGISGENLTMRLRHLSFKALLRQEIGFFDDHSNAVGVLLTRLATDASQVKGATGSRMGLITMTICTLLAAIIIAFVHGWQLTLLILACIPFLIGANFIRMKSMAGHASKDQKALEEAGRISTEAVENIRTVVSLTREPTFYEKYNSSLEGPYKDSINKAVIYGLTYAVSQSMNYFVNAAVFRFGAWLIAHCYMQFENVFIVFSTIIFAAMNVGQSSSLAPDFGKARVSSQRIMKLLDRKPLIDSYSEEGDSLSSFEGNIEFKDVKFVYPTRPKVMVLQGLNVKVSKGQTLALVGSSGCGKSTSVQLLERFYDPMDGQVIADGFDTKSLNLKWLRSQMGIVSQEPMLFDCSIAENIQYGILGKDATQEEIEEAARAANIHTFIENLPNGYNTRVGDKGAQLSGGQKQRIAIARALIRKPKVLLLDEATSALDTESEKIVQQALDDARQGRTCVVIAHRLSTVQNADIIAVIQNGRVIEQGTHSQLLAKQGAYYALVNSQVQH
ncbi:multidrug resistance 1-like isoform X1 [Pelobates cultripes]|uniref:ATP-binding cassette sub-family B member 5 n=1 Tax=Pelobates cultripes TaxID=61616 RepID=A0AAD1TFE0_PELCU|nr:multidrug resistance 1-like isoform X1 [Pelobates cultripes]CAH2322073.1 multidrug resistance 1-like isoform X1 [Pelobates cultripes]CAH2322074.1 multidrug resistance 1-like isoform X1 [Pelobates cultripes]